MAAMKIKMQQIMQHCFGNLSDIRPGKTSIESLKGFVEKKEEENIKN